MSRRWWSRNAPPVSGSEVATQPWLAPMLDWEEQQRARRSLERRLSAAVRHHQLRMDWVDPRVDPYT
jgi:hypothetical protein